MYIANYIQNRQTFLKLDQYSNHQKTNLLITCVATFWNCSGIENLCKCECGHFEGLIRLLNTRRGSPPHSSKADTFYFLTLVIRILLVHHRWFLRITNTELSEEIHEKRPVQIFTQLVQDKPEKFTTKYLAGIVKVILAYFFAELHFLQWKISFLILECKTSKKVNSSLWKISANGS